MPRVLLDFPWDLTTIFQWNMPASRALDDYDLLIKRYRVSPVPFLTNDELATFYEKGPPSGGNRYAGLQRFLAHCTIARSLPAAMAVPAPEPSGLRHSWKQALRAELGDLSNWRVPQIVAASSRFPEWRASTVGEHRVGIRCEDKPDRLQYRVIASLESYGNHPYAHSDVDPWDLKRLHPEPSGAETKPCVLPRPPALQNVLLEALAASIRHARHQSQFNGRHYYVPPESWSSDGISDADWRSGNVFPRKSIGDRTGYLDINGVIWTWDHSERHWDVQYANYVRVNHSGDVL